MSIRWEEPTIWAISRIIKNPAYAGAYIYGMRHWKRVQNGGEPAPEHRLVGQFVENWKHHEGYITREEYFENQRILVLNGKSPNQTQLGPGPALLAGRCSCARHGAMVVHYQRRVRRPGWSFRCQGDYLVGGDACVVVPGIVLEERVVATVLAALDPPVIEEARRLWRAAQRDWRQHHRGLQNELDRKIEALQRVKARVLEQTDASHVRVRAMLEDEFEKLAREVDSLKRRVAQEDVYVDPFTEERWEELQRLCADIHEIWRADTTTVQDRKQLIRLVVQRVVVDAVEPEHIVVQILWTDGRPSTEIKLLRTPYFHRLMWKWHLERVSPEEMVERLAAMGAGTRQARGWSLPTVCKTLAILVTRARVSKDEAQRMIPPVRPQARPVMLELRARGLGEEEVANRLNEMGLPTRRRAAWSASSVRRALSEGDQHSRAHEEEPHLDTGEPETSSAASGQEVVAEGTWGRGSACESTCTSTSSQT